MLGCLTLFAWPVRHFIIFYEHCTFIGFYHFLCTIGSLSSLPSKCHDSSVTWVTGFLPPLIWPFRHTPGPAWCTVAVSLTWSSSLPLGHQFLLQQIPETSPGKYVLTILPRAELMSPLRSLSSSQTRDPSVSASQGRPPPRAQHQFTSYLGMDYYVCIPHLSQTCLISNVLPFCFKG